MFNKRGSLVFDNDKQRIELTAEWVKRLLQTIWFSQYVEAAFSFPIRVFVVPVACVFFPESRRPA